MPKQRGTLQVMFRTLDDGCRTIHTMLQSGVVPAAAEIMDRICLEVVAHHRKTDLDPEVGACIIIEIDGDDDAALANPGQTYRGSGKGVRRHRIPGRHSRSRRQTTSGPSGGASVPRWPPSRPNRVGEDISVPRDAFPEVVRRIREISEQTGSLIAVYGHAGDGNLHPSILCDFSKPGEEERVHQAVDDIFAAALDVGGTLSGEHGIGITKRPYIAGALGDDRHPDPQGGEGGPGPEGDPESGKNLVTTAAGQAESCNGEMGCDRGAPIDQPYGGEGPNDVSVRIFAAFCHSGRMPYPVKT